MVLLFSKGGSVNERYTTGLLDRGKSFICRFRNINNWSLAQFLFQRGNIRPDEAPYAFVPTLEYHAEHARVYPFQIGEDAAVSYRHSESILFRKMARAVASVDLPFKIQFETATSGSVIVDFSYLRTRCCTINLIRAKIVAAREFVYIGDACQTKSKCNRVKLWIPGIGARTFEYVDEYFFPISLLSCWTHESGEQIDRTDSLSETFRSIRAKGESLIIQQV